MNYVTAGAEMIAALVIGLAIIEKFNEAREGNNAYSTNLAKPAFAMHREAHGFPGWRASSCRTKKAVPAVRGHRAQERDRAVRYARWVFRQSNESGAHRSSRP